MRAKMILYMALVAAALSFCPPIQAQQYNPESDFEVKALGGGKSVRIINYVGTSETVNIPPQINKLPVTHIGDASFRKKNLVSVTIPAGVTEIGIAAFFGNQLTEITIPASVTKIDLAAFALNQLASVTIAGSVINIAKLAFIRNPLTSVTMHGVVRLFGSDKADREKGLEEVFSLHFDSFYEGQGRRAGTYTRPDTDSVTWARQ